MNIFIVDPTPAVCAQYLDDKRVVKMVLETCQLLNNATAILHKVPGGAIPYKLTHICTTLVHCGLLSAKLTTTG